MKKDKSNIESFIPLDKSWIIRMGILDLLHNYNDAICFLEKQGELNSDLESLLRALKDWNKKNIINVGESGTLYRFLKFIIFKKGLKKKIICRGTLKNRKICNDPAVVNWPLKKLLTLDNGTSQWASAAVLAGDQATIKKPPFKLKTTFDAVRHWHKMREQKKCWLPRYDETIKKQAETFAKLLRGKKVKFIPQQAEDYCFARAFGIIDAEEGEKRWPSLRGHESDRIKEMEMAIELLNRVGKITSKDHRVVQAMAMLAKVKNMPIKINYPEAVNKSWPQFWGFLNSF